MSEVHTCDVCEDEFGSKHALDQHKKMSSPNWHTTKQRAKEMTPQIDSEYCVYVLRASLDAVGEVVYYVGVSSNLTSRIHTHLANDKPMHYRALGEGIVKSEYDVLELIQTTECDSEDEALVQEKRTYIDIAREYNTYKVAGGH